jgi:hypothetical protein
MRSNVFFNTTPGGLGRLPAEEDYVSAIIMPTIAAPAAWDGASHKLYKSPQEAEADGIEEGDATYGMLWYFMNEYFRMAGASELYIALDSMTSDQFFSATEGRVRQVFWYNDADPATTDIATFVGTVETFAEALETKFAPAVFITNLAAGVTIDGSSNEDLTALNSEHVSVLISGDNSGKGKAVADSLSIDYVPAGGTVLGILSSGQVHEHIGYVAKFNMQQGAELQKISFADGQDFGALSDSVLTQLYDKGYIFLTKRIGISGTYADNARTAMDVTADLYAIQNNRTLHKAKRLVRGDLLPDLNSPLTVEADGTLSAPTIKYFENKIRRPLDRMRNAGELSNYTVFIDPEQDVLGTDKLIVTLRIQPRGVARVIEVNIGFAANLDAEA